MAYTYPFAQANHDMKSQVWWKGTPLQGYDSKEWMLDVCGNTIRWADHGDTNSKFGWEIDLVFPKEHGGSDDLSNLQPLFWKTNRQKGDTVGWTCP